MYNNCSGNTPYPPNDADSTPFFKPQFSIDPLEANSWGEWLIVSHSLVADGSVLVYNCKWSLGDPASTNVPLRTFSARTHFPNGAFSHQVVHGKFES